MLRLCPSCLCCRCSAACSLGGFSAAALLLQDTTKAGGCSSLPPCGPLSVLWRRRAQSTGHNKGGPPVGCLLLSCSLRLLWPFLAFALLFRHKGGKRAFLCSCLPLLLKRSAGGSVLLLPLCSCPKEGRPFGLCCWLS